ncbi:MAG: hypothetical protein LBV43_08980 [Prevotella sp.]|jgi:hypothetical protein|nr:hypothetical protein [Prevotella sp.]
MRKVVLSIICLFVVSLFYFTSCGEDKSDDKVPPVIEFAKFNVNDTIWDGLETLITINDSTKEQTHLIDTVVIGKWLYISARFTDNEAKGLSTFKVETNLVYKGKEGVKDSLLEIVKLGRSIFAQNDVSVYYNKLVQISDTIRRNTTGSGVQNLGLVEGDYSVKVVCIDVAGNTDSQTFPVRFIRRNKIVGTEPEE